MNKVLKTSIILGALTGSLLLPSFKLNNIDNEINQVVAGDKSISDDQFVRVDNFLYSGKGFLMEFEYTLPSETKIMKFSFMDFASKWHRLTEHFEMTFKSDGSVITPIGNVFAIEGHYYFELMFSDLSGHLNKDSGEIADGTETLDGFYIPEDTVNFSPIKTEIICTKMKAYPVSEVRTDEVPGLTFKAFVPNIVEGAKYRMMIVPSSYLSGAKDNYKKYFEDNLLPFIDLECNPKPLDNTDPIYSCFGKGYSFKASMIQIKEDNYQIPFVAIPYIEVSGSIIYSNFIRNTKTTYYDECLKFRNDAKYHSASNLVKEETEDVIYKCEHHVTKTELKDVKAYFKSNTEKVFKNESLPGELITENVMYSAKNEVERGQIIIHVPSNFNKKYYASFEPFINSKDTKEVIGVNNIKIEQQLYQNVETNWSVGSKQQSKYYPDGKPIYNLPLGYVPDALLPFDVAFDSNQNILSSENGSNNALSFTINVPKNVKAGEYNSKIVIKISGEGTLALPVKLNVFDFVLPDETKAKQIINVNTSETKALYGSDAGSLSSVYNQSAYKMLRERNISGGQVPTTYWSTSDLNDYIKTLKEYAQDKKIGAYFLPNCSLEVSLKVYVKKPYFPSQAISLENLLVYRADDTKYDDKITLPGIKTTLRELVKASTNELDLLKKGIFYFPQADEPGNNADKQLQNVLCQNVVLRCVDELLEENIFSGKEKVKESLSKIRYIVTSYPRSYLNGSSYDYIDNIVPDSGFEETCALCYCSSLEDVKYKTMKGYCPTYDSYQWDISDVKNNGYYDLMANIDNPDFATWWYGCIQPITPYPSLFVNANLIQKRVNTWTMYHMGVQGELYYMCNRTQEYTNGESIPRTEEEILSGKATYEGAYGDGNLLYPVHNMYGEYDPNLYWLSSLRLDNIAESIDDYNYIAYAYELVEHIDDNGDYYRDRLNDLVSSVSNGPGRNTTNIEFYNSQRITLGNLVAEINKK